MPEVQEGPLAGFFLPDYSGGSIVHLLSSIIRSRGGESPHRELRGLPARQLSAARRLIYLIVDGLGEEQLERFLASGKGKSFLGRHPYRTISTVFPATTAAAITTFTTGASPLEHAVLGWHLHLPDLGVVSAILRATTRMGTFLARPEFPLREYLGFPSYVDSVPCAKALISYDEIPLSRYSMAGTRWGRRTSFKSLGGMEQEVLSFAGRGERGLAHAYWPGYDALCHKYGCYHRKSLKHLEAIDASLGRLAAGLEGMDAALVITADHGLVDTRPGCGVELRDVPGFYDCLAAIPSGDARCVQCFVRPAKVDAFLRIVERDLSRACACVRGEDLFVAGILGPGKAHRALASRLGDFVLLAKEGYAFEATPSLLKTRFKAGNHGGLSRAEVLVPLYVVGGAG